MNCEFQHPLPGGRGARSNVSSRYESTKRVTLDDGWDGAPCAPKLTTSVAPFSARTIITYNRSPDLGFDRSINPYKGCEHGCVYCYARPKHAYLGLSPGLDFESRIFSKPNAAALLRNELAKPRYAPAPVALGADTDPYQPVEKRLQITRAILTVLNNAGHPVGIVTKGALVTRDVDILSAMAERRLAKVALSITTLDRRLARDMEPRAATPQRRLDAIRILSEAGVPVVVMTAPLIPGLNDHEMEAILERAAGAGAIAARYVMLRLPPEIKDLFDEWLADERPDAARRVMSHVRAMHAGRPYDSTWFARQRGDGPYAQIIAQRFARATRRLGLSTRRVELRTDLFRPPRRDGQTDLFINDNT